MPSKAKSIPYIQSTNKNISKDTDTFEATVIANYGDPGLDEDYYADVLSRYVICILESSNRCLTKYKWKKNMIIFVKRPEQLWIQYEGEFLNSPSSQRRSDAALNYNSGPAGAYTADSIPRINFPYQIGERIKVKKIEFQDILDSKTKAENAPARAYYYGSWHSQGIGNLSYSNYSSEYVSQEIKMKTINSNNLIQFNKFQYEAAILMLHNSPDLRNLFNGKKSVYDDFYNKGNGGYLFNKTIVSEGSNFVAYEDINIGGKARVPTNTCLPLVVTSPNTFMTPKVREGGTINYTPTFIVR